MTRVKLDTIEEGGTTGQVWTRDTTHGNGGAWGAPAPVPAVADEVEATGAITTTSETFVVMTGMTITPAAGTYAVWASAMVHTTNKNGTVTTAIYAGGTEVVASERSHSGDIATSSHTMIGRVTVNGSEAVELRWKQTGLGDGGASSRQLMVIQVSA